jgi:hypothetical protein
MKNKSYSKTLLAIAGLLLAVCASSNAATIIPFDSITGFSGGDQYTPQDFTQINNGFGINKPDANDPSTWSNGGSTPSGATYQDEWYDNFLVSAANSKLGWISFDLGSSQTTLDNLYLINADAQSNVVATSTFNIYYADTPTVALPAPPGGDSAVDYDFASGGWTQLGTTRNLAVTAPAQAFDLSGIASARYIALEIMTAHTDNGRVGFDEAAITVVPEPSAFALLAGCFGLTWIMVRRRD